MPTIQVLDPHVADLIAAGEVVERPASVAKELMENAIDAGASAVTVEIAHGGMTFLRVTDDGCGIPAGQLPTAFLRHATSKLRSEYDLEAIGTLGFRGEALAAISAVSRMDVMTRAAGADLGASLSLEGGASGPVSEAGCPLGTTMVVRDLFFNTPARLKFLKKDAAEGAAVFAAVQRTALSHPEVSVKFIRDGKQELLTPGDGKLKSAVYAVLGRELALGLVPVAGSGEDMSVTGFVSLPACCRGSRGAQFFFVNGRQIKSRLMAAALEEAYKNQKMVGKFPACILHLETKLSAVDVNVHPAKTEVKFGSERRVFDAVYHAVRAALEGSAARPGLSLESSRPSSSGWPSAVPAAAARQYRETVSLHDSARAKTGWAVLAPGSLRERPEPPVPERENREAPAPAEGAGDLPGPEKGRTDALPPEREPDLLRPEGAGEAPAPEPEALRREPPAPPSPPQEESPCPGRMSPEDFDAAVSPPLPEEVPPAPAEEPPELPWRVAGEVLNTYIIVEQGDRVLFIDKHAAHERMNFDRMKAQSYQPMQQCLLVPVTLRPGAEELAALLDHLPLLEKFGFEAEDFGGGALIVRQAPFDVDPEEVENTLLEIAHKLLTAGRADPSAARDELLHTMACKAAIKGGWKSGPQELERVAQAVMSGAVKYCPHGRPTAVELTKKQLEKQFKRA